MKMNREPGELQLQWLRLSADLTNTDCHSIQESCTYKAWEALIRQASQHPIQLSTTVTVRELYRSSFANRLQVETPACPHSSSAVRSMTGGGGRAEAFLRERLRRQPVDVDDTFRARRLRK